MAQSDSVTQWLTDLRDKTELECMCVLQGKSLTKESADLVFVVPKSTKDHVHTVHQTMVLIKSEIKKFSRYVEKEKWDSVQKTSQKIIAQIQSQIRNCQSGLRNAPSHLAKLIQKLTQSRLQLAQIVDGDFQGQTPDKDLLCRLMTSLEESLQTLVDGTLCALIQSIIDNCVRLCRRHGEGDVEPDDAPVAAAKTGANGSAITNGYSRIKFGDSSRNDSRLLINALTDIVAVGLQSNYMCSLLAKVGGVSVLLEICRTPSLRFARGETLRALATICCVSESIEQLDQDGGISCLTDILADDALPEMIRSEAAGVIAQVTSPSLTTSQLQMGFMENTPDLVRSLTGLCRDASSHDVFLMSCAALANMTSIDSMTCEYFSQCKTPTILVESCLKNKAQSVFAREQVVTVLSNMASVDTCHKDLTTDHRVMELLVYFLNEHSRSGATAMELAACERVTYRSAMAIGQLSQQKPTAVAFVKLQCVRRLVQLCNDPVLRNHSDAVLMASLAALRKIFTVCGPNHELLVGEEKARRLVMSKKKNSVVARESFI